MVNSMVERATSSQLIGPDWAMNLEICDILNHEPGQAKDVVKGIKKRMGSKNPKVQLLTLTLLETVVKNCGDVVHMHVAEKDIPHEMVRITKKKPDFQVKEKILTLIDTWQEAFGGPRARYPQYYAAYQELLRAGAVFPRKSESSAPVFTPPQTQPLSSYPPNLRNLNTREETTEASSDIEYPSLSLTEIQNARGIMDVLAEMLSAIDPANKESLRQEVVVDLVEQCRTYKQRVMHLVNSTSDESLLCQGLALNDDLQKVLAKHEALVSGTTVPQDKSKPVSSKSTVDANAPLVDTGESSKQAAARSSTGGTISAPLVNGSTATPPPKADPKIDLLSGDFLGDEFSSVTPQDRLALVPVSAPQPSSPVANQQNALALVDMFSTPSSSNSHPSAPTGHAYPGAPEFQQHQTLQLPLSSMPYANGMATNMGLPQYEQSGGYPQAGGGGWNPQVAQQQPQSPSPAAYGGFNAQVAQQQPQSPSPAAYGGFYAQVAQQQPQSPSPAAYGAFSAQLAQQQPQSPSPAAYGAFSAQVAQQQPQPHSPAYGALNAQVVQQPQQQSQSPVYGAQNGGAFPPPPWEAQPAEINQPFSPSHSQPFTPSQPFSHNQPFSPQYSPAMSMGGQQSPTFQGGMHPFAPQPTGNDHQGPGMYAQQQMTGGSHIPGMNAQHMPNQMHGMYPQPYQGGPGPMMGMSPQAMQAAQMAQMYGNQMPGYGYGYGYAQQPDPQYLDQRMYGLSLRDDSSLKLGSSQSSMASYLPPMKQQPKGDDKLFGDLVDMAKLKPTKPSTPTRTGSV